MRFLPTLSTATRPPQYDAVAHALYVYVGASGDRRVATTHSSEGINFDCNSEGFVLGIEVLLNAADYLHREEVTIPRLVSDGWHNFVLDDDPDIDDAQTYDESNRILRIGIYDGAAPVFRIAKHAFVAPMTSGYVVVWISGLDLTKTPAGP